MLQQPIIHRVPPDFGAQMQMRGVELGLRAADSMRRFDELVHQNAARNRAEAVQDRQFGYNAAEDARKRQAEVSETLQEEQSGMVFPSMDKAIAYYGQNGATINSATPLPDGRVRVNSTSFYPPRGGSVGGSGSSSGVMDIETGQVFGSGGGYLSQLQKARSPFIGELENDPDLKRLLYASTYAEVGSQGPQAIQSYMESVMNRAAATNRSLRSILSDPGYYPDATKSKLGRADVPDYSSHLNSVLQGSNLSNFATDNASSGLAQRRNQAGNPGTSYGGELFYTNIHGNGGGGVPAHADWRKRMMSSGSGSDALPSGNGNLEVGVGLFSNQQPPDLSEDDWSQHWQNKPWPKPGETEQAELSQLENQRQIQAAKLADMEARKEEAKRQGLKIANPTAVSRTQSDLDRTEERIAKLRESEEKRIEREQKDRETQAKRSEELWKLIREARDEVEGMMDDDEDKPLAQQRLSRLRNEYQAIERARERSVTSQPSAPDAEAFGRRDPRAFDSGQAPLSLPVDSETANRYQGPEHASPTSSPTRSPRVQNFIRKAIGNDGMKSPFLPASID